MGIIHLKIADRKLWGKMSEIVELIESARKRGVEAQAHVYPYTPEQTPHREAGVRLVRLSLDGRGEAATLTAGQRPRGGRRA